MLFDPITTPACGHTFCRSCIYRAFELKHACPLCRSPLPPSSFDPLTHPTTAVIQHIVQTVFPEEYKRRKDENDVERQTRKPRYGVFLSDLPWIPLPSSLLPPNPSSSSSYTQAYYSGLPVYAQHQLHIFEAKYRVMVNQALATTRQFIVACPIAQDIHYFESAHAEEKTPTTESNAGRTTTQPRQEEKQPAVNSDPTTSSATTSQTDPNANPLPHSDNNANAPPPDVAPVANPNTSLIHDGDVGVIVRIVHSYIHPDGRSLLQCVAERRVRLFHARLEESDFGLFTAEIEDIVDENEEADEEKKSSNGSEPQGTKENDEVDDHHYKEDQKENKEEKMNMIRQRRLERLGRNSATSSSTPLSSASAQIDQTAAQTPSYSSPSASTPSSTDSSSQPPAEPKSIFQADGTNDILSPSDPDVTVAENRDALQSRIKTLVDRYVETGAITYPRLTAFHGPMPDDLSDLVWWVASITPDSQDAMTMKQALLKNSRLSKRLAICCMLLEHSINQSLNNTKRQSWLVGFIILFALGYFFANHAQQHYN